MPTRETITVEFHLDEDGKVVDVTSPQGKHRKAAPQPPHAWASAIITTKHSPGCFFVWTGTDWVMICN
jgi:hypothetical protein